MIASLLFLLKTTSIASFSNVYFIALSKKIINNCFILAGSQLIVTSSKASVNFLFTISEYSINGFAVSSIIFFIFIFIF